jgi:tRNA(Leu) C34 or U34 (ribose-2'-O)-methylase TrmL
MIGLLGFWDIGYSAPLTEANLWQYMAQDFAVDSWNMIPVSGIDRPVQEWASIEDFLAADDGTYTHVYVDEFGEDDLDTFEHPESAMYIFGQANYAPMKAHIRDGDRSVRITTARTSGLLWPHQAAAVILYDRYRKER